MTDLTGDDPCRNAQLATEWKRLRLTAWENRALDAESLLREIDKWCSGEHQVNDGEDAEDALRYIQNRIKAFLVGEHREDRQE